jgi:hypothetical protein
MIPSGCLGVYSTSPALLPAPALNPDGSVTFSQPDNQLSCEPVPPMVEAPCHYCFSWQLLVWAGGNVWVAYGPPQYPVATDLSVACETGGSPVPTNTTPPLPPGTYEMHTYLRPAPCGAPIPEGAPVPTKVLQFVIR